MKRIDKLTNLMQESQLIISDKMMIFYYTGHRFDVGERMIALLVGKDHEPILFLNKLFEAPKDIKTIVYEDGDDTTSLIENYLTHKHIAVDGNWASRYLIPFINKGYKVVNGSTYLEQIRTLKDELELATLIEASHHNDRIMLEMESLLKVGMTEIELAEIVREKQSTPPLTGVSFEPIVLFTENIADPHGVPSSRTLREDDVVLIDMGGIYQDYCSDMTRCFFMGENPEMEHLYKIVLAANKAGIDAVKPGSRLSDVDKATRAVIEAAGYGPYFVHRTGHGIGIECHENLDVSSKNDRIIEPGMCFSIEPGIYIPGKGGIRIEDLVHVTKDGIFVMNQCKKEFTDIKK